jgi:hypothetical protein
LIRQLQEQHYHQYMQQLYQQQCCQQKQEPLSTTEVTMDETARLLSNGGTDTLDREMDSEEDGTQGSYKCLTYVRIIWKFGLCRIP